jgi:hypothetical protein
MWTGRAILVALVAVFLAGPLFEKSQKVAQLDQRGLVAVRNRLHVGKHNQTSACAHQTTPVRVVDEWRLTQS